MASRQFQFRITMKIFTYTFDTEGGTDWTQEYLIMAENREDADEAAEDAAGASL